MSGIPGEIVTLQLGNYSNFVGAHLFNLQNPDGKGNDEEFDPLVFWRKKDKTGSTYTPRVLIFDTKDNSSSTNFGTQRVELTSKEKKATESLWEGKTEQILQEGYSASSVHLNHFENGKFWADLFKWKITHNTESFLIPNECHNVETGKISSFGQGQEIWTIMEDLVTDGIRKYSEECDNLQGFQMLVDQEEGFSGLAAGVLEHISEEYEKKILFGIGLSPTVNANATDSSPRKGKEFKTRIMNTSLLWNSFYQHSSVFSALSLSQDILQPISNPINLPFINYKSDSVYETSSIIAAALDNLTSPFRRRGGLVLLPHFAALLNGYGRKMATISNAFPFPLESKKKSFFGFLQEKGLSSLQSLTPGIFLDFEKTTGNYFVIRGVPISSTISEQEKKQLLRLQKDIKNPASCLDACSNELFPRAVNVVHGISTPTTLSSPFPFSIIDESALNSYSTHKGYSQGIVDSWSLSSVSCAHNTRQTGDIIENLINEVGGGNSSGNRVGSSLPSVGMETDDFLQCINELSTLREAYDISFG